VAINRTALALALSDTLIEAARAAVANINRKVRRRPKRAKKAFDCAEMIILSCFCRCGLRATADSSIHPVSRFIVAKP